MKLRQQGQLDQFMLCKVSGDAGKSSGDPLPPGALCLILQQAQPFSTVSAFLTYEGEETTLNTLYNSEKKMDQSLDIIFLRISHLRFLLNRWEQSPIWPN